MIKEKRNNEQTNTGQVNLLTSSSSSTTANSFIMEPYSFPDTKLSFFFFFFDAILTAIVSQLSHSKFFALLIAQIHK